MIAVVNPFTRKVIITRKDSLDRSELQFDDLDEIQMFVFDGLEYEAQFMYYDSFEFHVFGRGMEGYIDYQNNLINNLKYEF
jgi:uncharacterized protein Smg (DUF494 family)